LRTVGDGKGGEAEMEAGTSDDGRTDFDPRLEAALAHPRRAKMFAELSMRALDPSELAELLEMSMGEANYHYRVLERLGGIRAADERRAD
jgi:DNA-binding transcriptional ArsR family regulator